MKRLASPASSRRFVLMRKGSLLPALAELFVGLPLFMVAVTAMFPGVMWDRVLISVLVWWAFGVALVGLCIRSNHIIGPGTSPSPPIDPRLPAAAPPPTKPATSAGNRLSMNSRKLASSR